jgi:di/tricarboxylate transporter
MKFVDVEDNNIMRRFLEDEAEAEPIPTWEPVVTVVTVVLMFVILATDKVATESVMLTALCIFYLTGIIDIKEALTGFSSQGLLTVLILFVVAEGLNKTGALNWYIGKLFGRPKTLTGAQLRLTLPIAALSGFINDTPLVVVTLPIVVQWCRRVNLSPRFAMMPLSFAALLGGVITIIGTSTNLIIVGLLIEAYPDDPFFQSMPLFGLSIYGVPVALLGIAYMVLFTPLLLARNNPQHSTVVQDDNDASDPLLLRAKVTQFSPAADRT